MKKLLSILIASILLIACALPALADEKDKVEITVMGSSAISLAADTATLQIGVNTSSKDILAANGQNSEIMEKVIAAIVEAGVSKDDMSTSQYSVYMEYVEPSSSEKQSYQVSNTLTVVVRDLAIVSNVIDSAVDAGANNFYGLYFSSSKENEAYDKALTRAVEDAAHKAAVLAQATGRELGELCDVIADNSSYGSYGRSNTFDFAVAGGKGTAIVTGDVTVTASVTLVYKTK